MKELIDVTGDRLVPATEAPLSAVVLAPGRGRDLARSGRGQRGMVSAEWAVGIIAAIAIAGVLLGVVTSGPVQAALLKFILMVIRSFATGLG